MAESIIAPSLSLRDKFDLLNSAKQIIPLGETKTFSGKKYTRDEALAEVKAGCPTLKLKSDVAFSSHVYSTHHPSWTWAAIFVNTYSYTYASYYYGIGWDNGLSRYTTRNNEDSLNYTYDGYECFFPAICPFIIGCAPINCEIPCSRFNLNDIQQLPSNYFSISTLMNTINLHVNTITFDSIKNANISYYICKYTITGCIAVF